jgi:hypothetical protein
MSFAEFTSNKNKGVLWGLLQEGGVFDNIPASMFQNVKNIFEISIISMKHEFDIFFDKNDEGDDEYDKKATEMIINSNKSVIKKVIDEVNRIKMKNENSVKQAQQTRVAQAQAQAQQNSLPLHLKPLPPLITPIPAVTKKPKIEEIYRADDIKKTRMSELEIRLKEKQTEMDTMLNNKKPEHIDFSDKALGRNKESDLYDKKLAGDEMERLLAETLASRERELEKLNINVGSFSKGVSGGGGGGGGDGVADIPVNKIVPKRLRESKNVTFNDEDNTKMEYEKQEQEQEQVQEQENRNDENELSFFSKLKLKTGKSTPLDDIMNNENSSDDEDDEDDKDDKDDNKEEKEIIQLRVQEIGNFSGSREARETRETREAGETREIQQMQQMREMQRYIILEQRIKVIHDDLNEIKKTQGVILSILEKKMQ